MNVHNPKVRGKDKPDPRDPAGGEGTHAPQGDQAGAAGPIAQHDTVRPGNDKSATVARLDVSQPDRTGPDDTFGRPPRKKSSVVRLILMAIVPLIVVAAGYAISEYLKATAPESRKRPVTERSFAVVATPVTPGDYQPNLKLFGSTVTGRETDIRALVSGRVIKTSDQLREGGEVKQGETLLQIDPFDYENARSITKAQLAEARARKGELQASIEVEKTSLRYAREQTKLAEKDLERAKPLADTGALSKRTVDDRQQVVFQRQQAAHQLENNIAVWEARVAQQEATIKRLEASLGLAERRLEETRLKAPFNAYVLDVSSHVGRMISANDKVATLFDRDWIEARFTMTDQQFGRIVSKEGPLIGRSVNVTWELGGVTFSYPAKVERLGARVSSASGGVELFARLDDPSKPVAIRPGTFVEIEIPDAKFENVFRLANTSLYFGDTVFVIDNSRLKSRKVEVVGSDGADILVRGELKSGDRVLKTRISTPGDGVLVEEIDPQ